MAAAYPLGGMSDMAAFGLIWAVAGVLLGIRWQRERAAGVAEATGGHIGADRLRFGRHAEDGSLRRVQAMRTAYAAGALCCAAGFAGRIDVVLAFGAALVNLGTVYRYLVVALDRAHVDAPLFDFDRSGRLLLGEVLEQPLA